MEVETSNAHQALHSNFSFTMLDIPEPAVSNGDQTPPETTAFDSTAAVKLQKVYRSYRTRRRLADSAVVAEEFWWQLIDFARLNHSTISFFDFLKPESAASRWSRVSLNASKVGKGLSKDGKAQKLAFQHWIEAIDPRHRYGHSLHLYYEEWCKAGFGQPFFYWLDIGDGRKVDLKDCPRSELQQQCIKYLGPYPQGVGRAGNSLFVRFGWACSGSNLNIVELMSLLRTQISHHRKQEREHYEYIVVGGKITHKRTGNLLETSKGTQLSKWIFVMSTFNRLYVGEKKKGRFHHSSFLAGGATLAAGRLTAEDGILRSISPYSGHYRPTEDSFDIFLSFLRDNGVNLDEVQINKANEDSDVYDDRRLNVVDTISEALKSLKPPKLSLPDGSSDVASEESEVQKTENKGEYKRTLSGGLQSPRADVPQKAILERINSKKASKSYQLGHNVSLKWSTGAGPRIGCVADYPVQLRMQALEFVNLSPRTPPTPSSFRRLDGLISPTPQCTSTIPNGNFNRLSGLISPTTQCTSGIPNGNEKSRI